MSSITPIKLTGTDLLFGKAKVSLAHAKSFAVPDAKEPKMNVYCQDGNVKTTFHFLFANVDAMHKHIQCFISRTEMRPSLFTVRKVYPERAAVGAPVMGKKGVLRTSPSISFGLTNEWERGFFITYCIPLLSNVYGHGWSPMDPYSGVVIDLKLSEEDEVKRINDVFKRIMNRFDCGLNEALLELKDSRFPAQPKLTDESPISLAKEYNVTADGISLVTSTQPQENEEKSGNVNPTVLKSEEEQKQQTLLKEAIRKKPADNKEIRILMDAVLSNPNFDFYAFIEQVVGKPPKL